MSTTSQQIKQTRIYYKGLKQAAAAYTDKDQLLDLDYLINHKNTTKELLSWAKEVKDSFMLQFNVMIPMLQVFDYITKNKYVSDYISKVLEEGKVDKSSISIPFRASEIYEAMIGFNEISANQLLYLMCKESNQVYEQLCDAFERKDENEFIRVAKENDCDFETITKVLKRIPIGSDILKFAELVDKENNEGRVDIVKALKERSENPEEKETFSKLYAYLQEKDQAKKYDYLYLYWDDVRKRTPKSFVSLLLRYAKNYYYGLLSENELDVFVQILEHPLAVQFQVKYHNEIEAGMEKLHEEIEKKSNATDSTTTQKSENETITNSQKESQPTESTKTPISTPTPEPDQEDKTDSTGHLFPGSKYEFVPENYFEPDCFSKGHFEEHYELVERVKKHGLQAFVDFINYIASESFIENNDETKALLAYRLTGRMRPEKLDKIPWFKEKGEPKELYYVIKYFSPRSKTKFSKKMKDYFENDYFGVADYSRTAEDVSDEFKDILEDFFPGLTNTSKG